MFSYSTFKHEYVIRHMAIDMPLSADYRVFAKGEEIPVYTCRISSYPFNRVWPGHQREINQTELVSYVNLVSDEEIELSVEPLTKTAYERIRIKPLDRGVSFERTEDRISFRLKENGGYVLELDDYHGLL